MRSSKFKHKLKLKPKGELVSNIPKSFLRSNILPKNIVRRFYNEQIGHDEWYKRNAGGNWRYRTIDFPNPMFTSRNSHKQTNKK